MKIIPIKDDIYYAGIFIIPKSTAEELTRYFTRKYGVDYQHDNGENAFHYRLHSEESGIRHNYLIFEKFQNTPEGIRTFNHELMHLVFDVMKNVGMKFSEDSEEAFTYYLGYLTEKILDKLI